MPILHALILGIIQGITEFFPVSSSAHLKVAEHLMQLQSSPSLVLVDLFCHLGTAVAIIYFFKKELFSLFTKRYRDLALFILALMPLVPAYYLLKPLRELLSTLSFLGPSLCVTSLILLIGERFAREDESMPLPTKKGAMWIGAMQALALIPGISRSASTICSARILGLSREGAVRFSFLLSIPTIIGGNILESYKLYKSGDLFSSTPIASCAIAFIAALVTGLIIVRVAMHLLTRKPLRPFALYCLFFGVLCTVLLRG